MVAVSWSLGGFRPSPAFYACTMGLIPLSLSAWPVVVSGIRRGQRRYRPLVTVILAIAGPLWYLAMLMLININGHRLLRGAIYAVGRSLLRSSFSMRAGTWTALWLEVIGAWVIVLVALIAAGRRLRRTDDPDA
jgi:hypothetical protein